MRKWSDKPPHGLGRQRVFWRPSPRSGLGRGPLTKFAEHPASGIDPELASQVLAGLAATRLCVAGAADDSWTCEYAPGELKRLVRVLSGADHFRRMKLNRAAIELAVAMPLLPSYLEKELASTSVVPEVF